MLVSWKIGSRKSGPGARRKVWLPVSLTSKPMLGPGPGGCSATEQRLLGKQSVVGACDSRRTASQV